MLSDGGAIVFNEPTVPKYIPLNNTIMENNTMAFMVVGFLEVQHILVIQTDCSGNFCDRQRIQQVVKSGKGCGCFARETRLSNMVIKFSLAICYKNSYDDDNKDNYKEFYMDNFSSNKFSLNFTDMPFSPTVKWSQFDNTDLFESLQDRILSIIDWINLHGGWFICRWSKRGEINDVTMSEEGIKEVTNSTEVNHHVTSIWPRDSSVTNNATFSQSQFRMDSLINAMNSAA